MNLYPRMMVTLQVVATSLICHGAKGEETLNVPGEYSTISEAVATATNGDTILIQAGTYGPEQVIDLLGKAITLKGMVGEDGLPTTVIDGGGEIHIIQCINAEGPDTVIENLVLSNGMAAGLPPNERGGGLYCNLSSPTIRNCTFVSNEAMGIGGGAFVGGGAPVLEDCRFHANSALYGGGIYINNGSQALLLNCQFESNLASVEGGGLFSYNAPASLDDCRFLENNAPNAGGFRSAIENLNIQNSIICGNSDGQYFGPWNDNGGNCIFETCDAVTDSDSDGTPDCRDGCPNDAEKTEPGDCGCGIADIDSDSDGTPDCNDDCPNDAAKTSPGQCGCGVADSDSDGDSIPDCNDPCPTWIGDCSGDGQTFIVTEGQSIQAAVGTVPDDGTVLVTAGTYTEGIDFQGRSITLESASGLAETILDGSGISTSIIRVVNDPEENSSPVIRGFTIRNGTAGSIGPFDKDFRVGGGVFSLHASPIIENCVFEANQSGSGGGMYAHEGSPIIRGCSFVGNFATGDGAGVHLSRAVNGLIENCAFEQNSALGNGGGINLLAGNPIVRGNTINGNQSSRYGAGVNWTPENATHVASMDDCTVTNNMAELSGGGLRIPDGFEKNLVISDTTICDNGPNEISGAYIDLGGNDICNCTGDLNGDGDVNGQDLGLLMISWGKCPNAECAADLTGDNLVDGADFGLLLVNWGWCQ